MSATFEDSLLDFDVNYLQPPVSAAESKSDKQRRHVHMLKRKIISIDSLLKKFYAQREKWEQNEVLLLTVKEEFKQVCINYQEALERCTKLEKDIDSLSKQNAGLEAKCTLAQDRCEGMKSHANQLEVLIKEQESVIEALKIEKHLEKNISEDYENNLSTLQKENKALLKHLKIVKNIVSGKKKFRERHKVLLQKYDFKDVSSEEDSSSDESCDQDFLNGSPQSPLFTSPDARAGDQRDQNTLKRNKMQINVKKDAAQFNEDSDCSNEVVSEDTGRGSSLAFSDGEKCFNSPDYFCNDSPENIASKMSKNNEKIILRDASTSPYRGYEVVHVATSPLRTSIFEDEVLLNDNNMFFRNETVVNSPKSFINEIPLSNEIVELKEKRKLIDIATSPIKEIVELKEKRKLIDIATSPIKEIEKVNKASSPLTFEISVTLDETNVHNTSSIADDQTSDVFDRCDTSSRQPPCIVIDDPVTGVNGKHTVIDTLTSHCELEISGKSKQERKCLEINNSERFCDENSSDAEVDMILNTMRLERLITPIPKSPIPKVSQCQVPEIQNNVRKKVNGYVQNIPESPEEHRICLESIAMREENKILHQHIGDLKKDVMYIKCLLKNHLLNNDKPKEKISNENSIRDNPDIYDDTSQDSSTIYPNNDNCNKEHRDSSISNYDHSNLFENEPSMVVEAVKSDCIGNILQNSDISKQASSFNASELQNVSQMNKFTVNNTNLGKEYPFDVNNKEHTINKNDEEATIFDEDLRNEGESDSIINIDVDHNVKDMSEEYCMDKKRKTKKLSKLDKFKKKLLPKSKIAKEAHISKSRSKLKLLPIIETTRMDPTTILNNKSAYENAAKVMAEIKSKEKDIAVKTSMARKPKKMPSDENKNMDVDCFEQQQLTSDIEGDNPGQHIRRKSLDEHDLNDPHIETIQDIELQIEPIPITTRSRSRKLSNCSNVSKNQIDSIENDNSNSEENRSILNCGIIDSTTVENKRVLRSSSNRSVTDLDSETRAVINDDLVIISDLHDIKRKRKLSDSKKEEQNISNTDGIVSSSPNIIQDRNAHKIMTNTPNKKRKCKLSHSKDEEKNPSDNDSNAPGASNEITIHDRELSKTDNVKQDINYNIKNFSIVLNKVQAQKLSPTENQNINKNINNAKIQEDKLIDTNSNTEDANVDPLLSHPKQSILCKMLEKYGRREKKNNKKISDNITHSISKKLEEEIASINELSACKVKPALNKLVDKVQSWNLKQFLLGLMIYLNDPDRKRELFNKVNSPPAPPMTKSEQVVLYLIRRLETQIPNIVDRVLTFIEFSLFQLNRTPDFDVVESLSHIYALICRYFGLKNRLRHFLLDAMYCLQFKVIPLIKQCLDVWMHILPLAHMGIAKSPLVTCLVYLLHFYKCEDKFNRVKEIRSILNQKYFYKFSDWNEKKILEMFKNAIKEARDIPVEKKMLRMALILLGKRHGAKWCLKNIIKNILLPMIDSEDTPMKIKQFCVRMLGALLKPFPPDMKLHLEIVVSQLHDMLQQNPSDAMKEAIFTSLIYINHHNQNRLLRALLSWKPKEISPEFQECFQDYVRGKPINIWKKILSRMSM